MKKHIFSFLLFIFSLACKDNKSELFVLKSPEDTGITHQNTIQSTTELNVFRYRNFYNGGGVGIADINNDGLSDIYFTINRGPNKLYLNKGDFTFEDITETASIAGTKPWSTGVAMVDINADGWLDIYVCNAGIEKGIEQNNELFINQKDGTFIEAAHEYNLADSGITTHAAFFDYDKDGDLDVYMLNNSFIPVTSLKYNDKRQLRDKDWKVNDKLKGGGDRLLRNDGGYFTDVSEATGIYGSLIGFGLGVTLGDINQDDYIDIYISNDFYERDYLYINQQDGTYKEELKNHMNHLSQFSMGADMADINNDGNMEVFVTDMLPEKDQRLKETTNFEGFDLYRLKPISENYIGSYGGIYFKDSIKLDFPAFTNGYIREYDSITFLNWSGISLLKNGYQEDFFATDVIFEGIEINDKFFGNAIDTYEIKHPYYLLSTTKGLYNFNSETKKIILLQNVLNGPFRFIRGEKNINGLQILYLFNEKQLLEYDINENKLKQLLIKDLIVDVFSNTASEYYILTDSSLEFLNVNIPRKSRVLIDGLSNTNNAVLFKNFMLITSDQGLDLFDLNSNEIAKNVIRDELNYNAIYVDEQKIQLGGVNGLYQLDYQDLMLLFETNKPKIVEIKQNVLPYAIGSLAILVVAILILILIRQNRIIKNQRTLESLTTKDKIEAFIKLNIQNVSVELICETFDLPVNALYKALGNVKPGEIIRKERLKIVKRMRREKASEEEIAKATGFSVSYLKKI